MDIKSPTDVYGPDYFKKTWGDFFPDQKALGGMWDAIGDDFVVEIKTTKRAEDWATDVPIYYKLQAALYAYLLGFDNIVMTASFLEDKDYANPELFVPSFKNTKIYEFKLSEAFPDFEDRYVRPALAFGPITFRQVSRPSSTRRKTPRSLRRSERTRSKRQTPTLPS